MTGIGLSLRLGGRGGAAIGQPAPIAADATGVVAQLRAGLKGAVTWSKLSGASTVSVSASGALSLSSPLLDNGSAVFRVRAANATGDAVERELTLRARAAPPADGPLFTTPASIQHDGSPAVGETVTLVAGTVANQGTNTRRRLLTSSSGTVTDPPSSCTLVDAGATSFRDQVLDAGGMVVVESVATMTVLAAGAPFVIAMAGSSSPDRYLSEFTGGTPDPRVRATSNGSSFATLTAGRMGIEAGKMIADATGRGVDYIPAGISGSALQEWEADGSTQRAQLVSKINAVGRCDALLLQVGWNDTSRGFVLGTVELQAARLRSLITKIRTETSLPALRVFIIASQDNQFFTAEMTIVRRAEMTVATSDANVFFAASTYEVSTQNDGLHQDEAGQIVTAGRFADAFLAVHQGAAQKRGPSLASATPVSLTQTDVTLTHRGGTDFTPTSSIAGFLMSTSSGTALAISAAVRQSATVVRLTHATRAEGDTGLADYMPNAGPGDNAATVHDNAPRQLPLEIPVARLAVAAIGTATPTPTPPPSGPTATGKSTRISFNNAFERADATGWSTVLHNANPNTTALTNPAGQATGWSLVGSAASASTAGQASGNDSGFAPDVITRRFWFTDGQPVVTKLTGLDNTKRYRLEIFNSRSGSSGRVMQYAVSGVASPQTLNVDNNTSRTVVFDQVAPSSGEITVTTTAASGSTSTFAAIGAMVVTEYVPA